MSYYPESDEICRRAQRACDDLDSVRRALVDTRAQTQLLIAQCHQTARYDGWATATPATNDVSTAEAACSNPPTNDNPHELAMEALRMMRDILADFPIEWQVNIVKALTARTMVVVAKQLYPPQITQSA
jgi:hypothetical protein